MTKRTLRPQSKPFFQQQTAGEKTPLAIITKIYALSHVLESIGAIIIWPQSNMIQAHIYTHSTKCERLNVHSCCYYSVILVSISDQTPHTHADTHSREREACNEKKNENSERTNVHKFGDLRCTHDPQPFVKITQKWHKSQSNSDHNGYKQNV